MCTNTGISANCQYWQTDINLALILSGGCNQQSRKQFICLAAASILKFNKLTISQHIVYIIMQQSIEHLKILLRGSCMELNGRLSVVLHHHKIISIFQSVSSLTSVAPAPSFHHVLWWRTTLCGKWATTEKFTEETRWKLKFTPTDPSGRVSHPPQSFLIVHPPTASVWRQRFTEVFTKRFLIILKFSLVATYLIILKTFEKQSSTKSNFISLT